MKKSAADGLKGASGKVPTAQSDATRVTPKKVETPQQTIGPRTSGRRVIAETAVRMASPIADAGASAAETGAALRRGDMKGVAKGLVGTAAALTGAGVIAGAARSISRARQTASNPVAQRVMRGANNPRRAASQAGRLGDMSEARADVSALRAKGAPGNLKIKTPEDIPNPRQPLHNPTRLQADRRMVADDHKLATRDFVKSVELTKQSRRLGAQAHMEATEREFQAADKITRKERANKRLVGTRK